MSLRPRLDLRTADDAYSQPAFFVGQSHVSPHKFQLGAIGVRVVPSASLLDKQGRRAGDTPCHVSSKTQADRTHWLFFYRIRVDKAETARNTCGIAAVFVGCRLWSYRRHCSLLTLVSAGFVLWWHSSAAARRFRMDARKLGMSIPVSHLPRILRVTDIWTSSSDPGLHSAESPTGGRPAVLTRGYFMVRASRNCADFEKSCGLREIVVLRPR